MVLGFDNARDQIHIAQLFRKATNSHPNAFKLIHPDSILKVNTIYKSALIMLM